MNSIYKAFKIGNYILTCGFLFLVRVANAQTEAFTYTQYMDNLIPLNPAYSTLDKSGSVTMLARRQWIGVDGSPTTFLINGNFPIENITSAAGMSVVNDEVGIERETEVNAYFAKAIRLGPTDNLSVSLNAGIRNYVANYTSINDNSDPVFANNIRENKPNVGFGMMYYSNSYYIGVSVPELTITSLGTASIQNNTNFVNHYYVTGAVVTDLADGIKFKPSLLFSYASGIPLTADFSGIVYFKEIFGLGLTYRSIGQMAGIITLNIHAFHIGYSYEFGTASEDLGSFNIPTQEVTLSYRFGSGSSTPRLL